MAARFHTATRGQNWKTLTTQDGLTSNRVFHISQDAHGNLWFCCGPEGISCYAGHVFKTLTTEDGLTPNFMLFAFQDAEGVLWFAGGGGVNRYDNQTIATFAAQDGLVYDWRRVIEEDANSDLWFGIPDGALTGMMVELLRISPCRTGLYWILVC